MNAKTGDLPSWMTARAISDILHKDLYSQKGGLKFQWIGRDYIFTHHSNRFIFIKLNVYFQEARFAYVDTLH